MRKVFDGMKAGLEDALAYAKGDSSKGRAHRFMTSTVNVKAIRAKTGLTQVEFADTYAFSLSTLKKWETRVRVPDTSAKAYLAVIAQHPRIVRKVLSQSILGWVEEKGRKGR